VDEKAATSVVVAEAVSMFLKNPALRWDGKTRQVNGSTIEQPGEWDVNILQKRATDGAELGTPYIFHKPGGFSIDGAFIPFDVRFEQHGVTLPPGIHWLSVDCESHVIMRKSVRTTLGNNSFWRLFLEDETGTTHESPAVPLLETKGDQSFAVRVIVPAQARTVSLALSYASMWGVTDGAMRLKRIAFEEKPGDRRWSKDWTIDLAGRQPPLEANAYNLWDYLIPAEDHVHRLSSGEWIFADHISDYRALIRKNRHFEDMHRRAGFIWRGADDSAEWQSPSGQRVPAAYVPATNGHWDEGGNYGHKWLPETMRVGDTFTSESWTTFHKRSDGTVLDRQQFTNHYRLAKHHAVYKGVRDVLEIEWRNGDPDKATPDEIFRVGKHKGYIEWERGHGGVRNAYERASDMGEVRQVRVDRRYQYSWLPLSSLQVEDVPVNPPAPPSDYGERIAALERDLSEVQQQVKTLVTLLEKVAINDAEPPATIALEQRVRDLETKIAQHDTRIATLFDRYEALDIGQVLTPSQMKTLGEALSKLTQAQTAYNAILRDAIDTVAAVFSIDTDEDAA
jgi:hypothetical protein